ncbi:hypothetical protein RQP46_002430 [Phenoliferia psychrophenolica]
MPPELKRKVVQMTSWQEAAWAKRIGDALIDSESDELEEARAVHVNSLSSLALVNKQLRELAAEYQFQVLLPNRAALPVFRYSILDRFGHHFTTIRFEYNTDAVGVDAVFTVIAKLPSIRALVFTSEAAGRMFGYAGTFETDPKDYRKEYIVRIIATIAAQIRTLELYEMSSARSIALIEAFPNLRTLRLFDMTDEDPGHELAKISRLLLTASSLTEFAYERDGMTLDGEDPTAEPLLTFLASQPTLRRFELGGPAFRHLGLSPKNPCPTLSPSSLVAYTNIIDSRGFDASILNEAHLNPFHSHAVLPHKEEDIQLLTAAMGLTLAFGKVQLERMVMEGDVKKAVGWFAKLKALENERLAWRD